MGRGGSREWEPRLGGGGGNDVRKVRVPWPHSGQHLMVWEWSTRLEKKTGFQHFPAALSPCGTGNELPN